jgi:hypothetical protein
MRGTTAICLLTLALVTHAAVTARANSSESERGKLVLNKVQLACVAAVLRDMQKRNFAITGQQMIIRDEKTFYEVLVTKDPIDFAVAGGEGVAWKVNKKDLAVSQPIFQR